MLTVIILTKNEERHLERALTSVADIADACVVVDSGSTDGTLDIAKAAGAVVLENSWVNYASQFNWGLSRLPPDTDWVLRLDADEVVTEKLASEIREQLAELGPEINGIYVPRRMCFMGRQIKWGGESPMRMLRLFRRESGRCENRWMDEHIQVDGGTLDFEGEIIDHNLKSITWWVEKHNSYASREVIDLLNLEYHFMPHESVADLRGGTQTGIMRWIKERAYSKLPLGLRAFAYFVYRYLFRLGFLDGFEGTAFHVLQGFWFRYLVDVKLREVKVYMQRSGASVPEAIREVLGIRIAHNSISGGN